MFCMTGITKHARYARNPLLPDACKSSISLVRESNALTCWFSMCVTREETRASRCGEKSLKASRHKEGVSGRGSSLRDKRLKSLDMMSGCCVGGAEEVERVSRVKRRTRA
jgi:hypothetical protein